MTGGGIKAVRRKNEENMYANQKEEQYAQIHNSMLGEQIRKQNAQQHTFGQTESFRVQDTAIIVASREEIMLIEAS
jgi:hypothetical protein